MDADPGQIIRSLRLALEMSQTEFARAAGWSPSTISGWERGRMKPSRLAFKTILAFAEERGVQYRPRAGTTALLTLAPPVRDGPAAVTPPGPRVAFRPLLYPDRSEAPRGAREADATHSGHPVPDIAARWTREPGAESRLRLTEPPRWKAEANFRLTLGARQDRDRSSSALSRRLIEVAIVALGFCAAFGLREPVRRLLHGTTPLPPASTASVLPAAPAPAAPRAAVAPRAANVARVPDDANRADDDHAARDATDVATASSAATAARDAAPAQPPTVARLESVMAIGGAGRATFRTANDAVTVVAGEWLGGQRVVAIDSDAVTLVDRAGERHRIPVGQHAPLD